MRDPIREQIEHLVDHDGVRYVDDIPRPELGEILAQKLHQDAVHNGFLQTWQEVFEDAADIVMTDLLGILCTDLRIPTPNDQLRDRILVQVKCHYRDWLQQQIDDAASTSDARLNSKGTTSTIARARSNSTRATG